MITQIDQLYQPLAEPVADIAADFGIQVIAAAHYLDFRKGDKVVRISVRHFVYGEDIARSFDYYHDAVKPVDVGGVSLVDYSTPRYHDVVGFDLMPVFFASFAEPVKTTTQYLDFAGLGAGASVIDLGAYAGLTSIIFKQQVGESGRVVAVDADRQNVVAIERNLALFERMTGDRVDFKHAAIWNHTDGLSFSSEGNMGSAVSGMMTGDRGVTDEVPSATLSSLVEEFGLERVDFIKCDVEGAELKVFEDEAFFERFKPRIIVESHEVDGGGTTTGKFSADLERHGYTCRVIDQHGVVLPLVECHPPQ